MQDVREIRFVYYDDENHESPKKKPITADMELRYNKAFDRIEQILDLYLDVTPEIASIKRDGCEMVVTLVEDLAHYYRQSEILYTLKKLEEFFRVTYLEWDTEHDDFYDTNPHVLFGFYGNE